VAVRRQKEEDQARDVADEGWQRQEDPEELVTREEFKGKKAGEDVNDTAKSLLYDHEQMASPTKESLETPAETGEDTKTTEDDKNTEEDDTKNDSKTDSI